MNLTKLIEEYSKVAFLHMTKLSDIIKTDRDHNTLMELLMRHVQIANLNGIQCLQYQHIDFQNPFDCSENVYSQGIYQFSSLFKHSCDPNISIIGNGSKIIVYCNRPIKNGSQLLRNYGRYVILLHTPNSIAF